MSPFKDPHVNVGVSEDIHRLLRVFAAIEGETVSDLADRAIVTGLVQLSGTSDDPSVRAVAQAARDRATSMAKERR